MRNKLLPVSALYVRSNSIYKSLNVDCWDIERNALLYSCSNPVICHPPCRAWGNLSYFAKPLPGEKELAFHAIDMVRQWGGVLEHPITSKLWPEYLPLPGSIDKFGGFSISINQHWFGHKARKSSFLYFCGLSIRDLPPYPLNFDAITHVVGRSITKNGFRLKELSKAAREQTPVNLAKWLIDVCLIIKKTSY